MLSAPVVGQPVDTGRSVRFEAFDAARGVGMLLVCLSHFSTSYLHQENGSTRDLMFNIGMIASPTFVAVSGIMLGLLSTRNDQTFSDLRVKLTDRALFMLVIAHNLITLSLIRWIPHGSSAMRRSVMTDTIAGCLLAGVWLVTTTSRRLRIGAGIACVVVAWVLVLRWSPNGMLGEDAKELLVGAIPYQALAYTVPMLPWFGVYLICTAFGQHLGGLYLRGDRRGVERAFLIVAVSGIGFAIGARLLRGALEPSGHAAALAWAFAPVFSPWQKIPPSPAYMAFFGGLGFGLLWLVMSVTHRGWFRPLTREAATIGRCSLAVFVAQYFMYYTLLGPLRLPYSRAWPLLLLASFGLMLLFARVWDRHKLNAVLTVGLSRAVVSRWQLARARHKAA